MEKGFYLKTCDTCNRIIKEVNLPEGYELQEIKTNHISEEDLTFLKSKTGSYESLLNKRSRKYSTIKDKGLSDDELKSEILNEYTFLKRPVFVFDETVFVGNAKKTIEELKAFLNER
jgi:arsenate reductase (glutaredoxin)